MRMQQEAALAMHPADLEMDSGDDDDEEGNENDEHTLGTVSRVRRLSLSPPCSLVIATLSGLVISNGHTFKRLPTYTSLIVSACPWQALTRDTQAQPLFAPQPCRYRTHGASLIYTYGCTRVRAVNLDQLSC